MAGLGIVKGMTLALLLLAVGCGSGSNAGGSAGGGGAQSSGGQAGSGTAGTGADSGQSPGGASSAGGTGGASGGGGASGNTGAGGGSPDPYAPEFVMGFCVPKGPPLAEVQGVEVIDELEGIIDEIEAVDQFGGDLFWVKAREGIHRRAAGAAQAELVVDTSAFIQNLLARDGYVYWIQDNAQTLMRASLATLPATPEEVLPDVRALGLMADAQNLYFIRQTEAGIFKLPLAEATPGGGATPVSLTNDTSGFMSVNSERLFYVQGQALYAVPIAGGEIKGQGSLGGYHDVFATDDALYIISSESIYTRQIDGPTNGTGNTPLARGNLRSETSEFRLEPRELRVEGDRVYYREEGGALAWVKTDGSDCRIVADVPNRTESDNLQWVMDDTHYYVIEADNKLVSIPR